MKRTTLAFAAAVIVVALAAAVMVAGCGSGTTSSDASPSAPPTGPIKVGHIANLTGAQGMVGDAQDKVLKEAFKQMGGIAGRPVEVVTMDAGGESGTAVDAARKLVEADGVVAVFGPTEIGQKMAVAQYMKSVGLPAVIYNPSPEVLVQGNKWVVGAGGTTPQMPSCMGDYIYQKAGYKTINTLTYDDSAGKAFMDPLTQVYTQEGGKVVKQQWVPGDAQDFSTYLTTLPKADALIAWEAGASAIALWSQWYGVGLYKTTPMDGSMHGGFTDSFVGAALPEDIGDAMVGAMAPGAYAPDSQTPENKTFQDAMTPVLGFPPGPGFSSPWQAALLFQAAVQATSGDTSPEPLLEALLGASIVGPEGPESFAEGQQLANKNTYILEVVKVPNMDKVFTYKTVATYEDVPPEGFTPQ